MGEKVCPSGPCLTVKPRGECARDHHNPGGSLAVVVKQARRTPFHERAGWVHQRLWTITMRRRRARVLAHPVRRSTLAESALKTIFIWKRVRPGCLPRIFAAMPVMWGAARPPEIGSARSRPRQHNHDPRSLLALDSHHGKARRRRHGRGFGLVTAALLLPSPWYSRYGFLVFHGICRKNKG